MGEKPGSRGHILLIDHDEEWLRSTELVLQALGYAVQIARNTKEALALEYMACDLVLMNWIQADQAQVLLRHLVHRESDNPRCVIVMFSIQQLPERMRVVFKAGAYDCVDKPFDQEEVIKLVEALEAESVIFKDG